MCFSEMKHKVGFRFRPTDEELINYYLKRKLQGKLVDKSIAVVEDFLKNEPWELPALSAIKSKDRFWYFIYPVGKYKSSKRASRKTGAGCWKATGVVRKIWAKKGTKGKEEIGFKRTLVFYKGSVSNKSRTNWVMHEYHATTGFDNPAYVICRLENKPDGKVNTLTPDEVESSSDFGNHVAQNTVLEDSMSMADLDQIIGCDETIGHKNLVVGSDSLDLGAVSISSAQQPKSLIMSCGAIAQGDSLSLDDLQRDIGCDEQDYNFYLTLPPLPTKQGSFYQNHLTQFGTFESYGLDWGADGISSAQPLESGLSCIEDSGMSNNTENEVAIAQAREATKPVIAIDLPTMKNSDAKISMKSSWNGQDSDDNHKFSFMFFDTPQLVHNSNLLTV